MHPTSVLTGEPLISLTQAAGKFPGHRGAARMHPATLTRWILTGVTATDGRRVRLEAVRAGHRWLTSEQALARFVLALTPTAPTTERSDLQSTASRRATDDRTTAALVRAGA